MSNVNRRIETITSDTAAAYERGFRAPFNGSIVSSGLAVNVAVTVATSNLKMQIDNVDVTGAAHAVTIGRAVGYTEKVKPTALNTFREGQYLSVVGDGGGDAGNCSVTFELQED